jgi:YihY family inner membrane protein
VWHEKLASEPGKLQRAGVALGRTADMLLPSLRYIFSTEVHAYAFSIAANAYLSFFPFTLILLAVCRRWLHWEGAYQMVLQLLRVHLPIGADSVVRSLILLVQGRPRLQLMSVLMLFFTTSGVFLPLEIALNKVWGFQSNRSFLKNQAVSFLLALVCALLALSSVSTIAVVEAMITFLIGWIPSKILLAGASRVVLETASFVLAVSIFVVIYRFLPNGEVAIARVLPAAVATGILTEVGKGVYFLTLPMFRFREVYGPYALSVTLLFWAYVGALILLFGAHLSARGLGQRMFARNAPGPNRPLMTSPQGGS